jgi:hypothetical protein
MFEVTAEHLLQGRRVAGVLVGGDLVRRRSGDRDGGAEERFGGFLVASLAQVDVDQVAVAVDRPVQILPLARDFDVRPIDTPAPPGSLAKFSLPPRACRSEAGSRRYPLWLSKILQQLPSSSTLPDSARPGV